MFCAFVKTHSTRSNSSRKCRSLSPGAGRSCTTLDYRAMPELPEVEITARLIGAALAGARVESALAPGHQRAEDLRPAAERDRGPADRRDPPARQAVPGRARGRADDDDAPDVRGAAAAVRHPRVAARPDLEAARSPRRRARAAAARVRHQAARLGEAAALRRGRRGGDDRRARTRGVARSAAVRGAARSSRARCTRCCATST